MAKTETVGREKLTFEHIKKAYDWEGLPLLIPVITLFTVLTIIPVSYGLWLSTQTGMGALDLQFTGLDNYESLFAGSNSGPFWDSVSKGLVYAIYSVSVQVILGVVIALALNNIDRFQNITRAIVFVPYMIPTVAVAVVFRWFLNKEVGLLNYYLPKYGIIESKMNFFTLDLAMHTVVWASAWKWSIFVVIIVTARLQSIDQILYEAAKVNGASTFRQFMDVTWPNIQSALFLIILLRSIWMFNKFDMIYLLTAGGPLDSTRTMVIYAYREAFTQFNFGMGAATTTVMFLMLLVFGVVYFKIFSPEEEVEVTQ